MTTSNISQQQQQQQQQPAPPPPLLVALAGPTSSGKTTLASALSLIFSPSSSSNTTTTNTQPQATFNSLIIIHADDFYLPDSQIPTLPDGTQDWDCPEALDIPRFRSVLSAVRSGADVPHDLIRQGGLMDGERGGGSEHHNNNNGVHGISAADKRPPPISPDTINALRERVSQHWTERARQRRIVLVEGILLFSPLPPSPPAPHLRSSDTTTPTTPATLSNLTPLYDIKFLLRSTRTAAKRRREKRNGYVTLEGFWRDPEGYFDRVVWPGFVRVYGPLFEGGNVEGKKIVGGGGGGGDGGGSLEDDGPGEVLVGPVLGDGEEEGDQGSVDDGDGKKGLEGVLAWIVDVLGQELAG